MSKGTISREEIRETLKEDELGHFLKRAGDFIQRHSKGLIAALVLVIVALIGWKLVEYRDQKAQENASIDYVKARQDFDRALLDPQAVSEERSKLLLQAVKRTDMLRGTYPGTTAARDALYLQAKAYLSLPEKADSTENTEKALATFRQYVDSASDPEDKARGLLGLAAAYQNRGWLKNDAQDYQRAEETYQEILKSLPATSYLVMEAKLESARLYAARGEVAKATTLYRELVATAPKHEPPKASTDEGAMQALMEKQRLALRQRILNLLDRGSYADIAESELKALSPAPVEPQATPTPQAAEPAKPEAPTP